MSAPTHPTESQPTQPPAWQPPPNIPPPRPGGWGAATNPPLPPRPPRRRRVGRTLAWAFVGLLVFSAVTHDGDDKPAASTGTAATTSRTPEPLAPDAGAQLVKVGTEVGVTHDKVANRTAEVIVSGVRVADDPDGLFHGWWLVAAVEVTALQDGITTPDFYVVDRVGRKYSQSPLEPDGTHYLTTTTLAKGQSIAGVVTFDVPLKHGKLVLPDSDGKPQLAWKF